MSQRLNQTLQTQQVMITSISHEMRTSLNTILGYLHGLKNEAPMLQDTQQQYLQKAGEASEELRMLVSKILDISKINAGQMELKNAPFWLDDVVLESVETAMRDAERKNILFTSDIDFFDEQLIGDAKHIGEILTHLLGNAVKFTEYGSVHLRIEKKEAGNGAYELLFTVTDTGIGMTQEQTKTIFDPYVRFAPISSGVGLGLFIVSKLARKMSGELSVQSRIGEGSIFNFSIQLPKYPETKIDLRRLQLCFFGNIPREENSQKSSMQLHSLLKHYGADVKVITDEKDLMEMLLDPNRQAPSAVMISIPKGHFARYDALVHYLKSLPKLRETKFFAQQSENSATLHFFDKTFGAHAPLSFFIRLSQLIVGHEQASEAAEKKAFRILAVDDIVTNLEVLKLFVTMLYPNALLDLASGGYEAIGMYKTVDYDLVLIDLKMPGLDGFTVIEKLRAIKPLPPVFAITADIYKNTFEKVMASGFNGMLEKPIQPDVLKETIRKVINEASY
jgi:two-component system sensor histidine kinase BarA